MYKTGFIGAGKVGISLGKYLFDEGLSGATLCGYYSKSMSSSEFAAKFTNSKQFKDLKTIVEECEILIITTPDDVIVKVWEEISKYNIQNKIVCHCSGSLSSGIFFKAANKGVKVCSMHPLMAVSNREKSFIKMKDSFFTLEGDEQAVGLMARMLKEKGNSFKIIDSLNKVKYHAASVYMSNLVIGISNMAFELMKECGFSEKEAIDSMKFLALGNLEKLFQSDPKNALTGPIERNDLKTVKRHLDLLESMKKDRDVKILENTYKSLSLSILEIAEAKYPQRDYTKLREALV